MKIGIITYEMIPSASTWGGCQRMYFLAENLIKNGNDVVCYSCKKNIDNCYGNKISFENVKFEIGNKILRDFVYSKGAANRKTDTTLLKSNGLSLLAKMRTMVKKSKWIFTTISSIDTYIFNDQGTFSGLISRNWIKTNKAQIIASLHESQIKTVIISGPPFGLFSFSKCLKKEGFNVILDYRDPWNMWTRKSLYAYQSERNYLKYADMIVCTNTNLAEDMASEFGISKDKVAVISNGYSVSAWDSVQKKPKDDDGYMYLMYVGAMDLSVASTLGYRDLSKLFIAFDRCVSEGLKIKLCFVGVTNLDSEVSIQLKKKYGDNICLCGVVPNIEANAYMTQADVLMLLHTTNDNSAKYLVNGKMYDYIRAGKYIISIGSDSSIHKVILDNYSIGKQCRNNEDEIYTTLKEVYQKWVKKELSIPEVDTYQFSREYQNDMYYELLQKIEMNN